ncbi:hypothetical protein KAR91_67485 [Candidatus Pacearchaeota archaeon]|nr:hypothetical protein [Candidatus Pacearchaeota archaeon]
MGKNKFHVAGLKIKDLRNIDIVDVDLQDKKFVEINGDNGAAKSTIIDAFFLAILGKKYLGKGYPAWRVISKDKDKALIRIILRDGERELEIKRSIIKKTDDDGNVSTGGSLVVKDTNGKDLKQGHLDTLINEFTVDPVSFSKEPPKKQIEIVKRLAGIDTTTLEEEKQTTYEERTEVNREIKRLTALVSQEAEKVELVDLEELTTQLDDIEDRNTEQDTIVENNKETRKDQEYIDKDVKTIESDIQAIENKLKNAKKALKARKSILSLMNLIVASLKVSKEKESNEAVKLSIKNAQTTNEDAAKYTEWIDNKALLKKENAKAKKLSDKLKDFEADRKRMIMESNLPFDNLDFDNEAGLLIDGIPFSQKSDAEKIRISCRIGMEDKPGLHLICIKDGSLLDDKSYEIILQMAQEHSYQVMVESIGERPGENCIVMRQGCIISKFEKKTTAGQEADRMRNSL